MKYNELAMIDVDRLLGSTYQLHRSLQRIQDAMMPPSMRSMFEMQERIRVASATSILDLACLGSLHTSFVPHERLFASMAAVTNAMHGRELLSGVPTGAGLAAQLHDMLGPQLAMCASPTFELAQNLGKVMPAPLYLQWQEHLVRGLAPSFDVLSRWSEGPVGLLAFLSEPNLGASLTWLGEEEDEQTSAAALLPEGRYLPKLCIDTVVHCFVCGAELVQTAETFRWKGNRIRIDITVVPICATCLHEARDYPDHVLDAIDDLDRPQLCLVHDGGASDGVSRGRGNLRLVTPGEDCEIDDESDRE